ncbi:MAG: hypothetical protein WAT70_12150, partial [Rhizobiaceae bacterium]
GHDGSVTAAAFSPDGRTVLTGSWDNTARLWEAATGKELRRFEGHENWVTAAAFSPDGRTVLTGSWDNTARLWEAPRTSGLDVYRIAEIMCRKRMFGQEQFTEEELRRSTIGDLLPRNPVAACLEYLQEIEAGDKFDISCIDQRSADDSD